MPFESEKQRRFMHARHPKIAKKWEHSPEHKRKNKDQNRSDRHFIGASSKLYARCPKASCGKLHKKTSKVLEVHRRQAGGK